MGRRPKVVVNADGVDRREDGYYSTPKFVADFLARKALSYRPSIRSLLDPCVGKGELLAPFAGLEIEATGIDVVNRAPAYCSTLIHADFLELAAQATDVGLFSASINGLGEYDLVVANPPYNCHETDYIRSNKNKLVARYGKSTALNMYSLFVRAIIDIAKDGALIALIVHDSFLTSVGHKDLRDYIFKECTIKNIHLCPTSLFSEQKADVRTCLMIMEKCRPQSDYKLHVTNRPASVEDFRAILASDDFDCVYLSSITLGSDRDNREVVIGLSPIISSMFCGRRLADIAPCITGISTGNDAKYISSMSREGFSIPFYKNPASRKFYAKPDGFLIDHWEIECRNVQNFMVRNKNYLRNGGISCSSMGVAFSATIRPPDTLCGVNPNIIVGEDDKWWLLAYLNSTLCFYLLRAVIIRSNMVTAGYASRIPVPSFDECTRKNLERLAKDAFSAARSGADYSSLKCEIDDLVLNALNLDVSVVAELTRFAEDPTRLT